MIPKTFLKCLKVSYHGRNSRADLMGGRARLSKAKPCMPFLLRPPSLEKKDQQLVTILRDLTDLNSAVVDRTLVHPGAE